MPRLQKRRLEKNHGKQTDETQQAGKGSKRKKSSGKCCDKKGTAIDEQGHRHDDSSVP